MEYPLFEQYSDIIPDFPGFQKSLFYPFPIHLRINALKSDPILLVNRLKDEGVRLQRVLNGNDTLYVSPDTSSPGNLLEYFLGFIHPQALTSCLASLVLGPRPESYVLDMCASPGGKTSHMAQLMNNTGLIVANELYPTRHIPLAHTLSRLGVVNGILTGYQAQEFPLTQRFDFILADVPCSGEGRVRLIHEDRKYGYQTNPIRLRLLEVQKKIILRGYDLLKDEGEMLYSTCSYNPEENETVVHYLLENRDAVLRPVQTELGHAPGITQWGDRIYDKQLEQAARFYPHQTDSVGFFMARIGKRR
jgi:NOL1/NOP2/sun family putative RNA methylase